MDTEQPNKTEVDPSAHTNMNDDSHTTPTGKTEAGNGANTHDDSAGNPSATSMPAMTNESTPSAEQTAKIYTIRSDTDLGDSGNEGGSKTGQDHPQHPPPSPAYPVANIEVGAVDYAKQNIEKVYFKREKYAVYLADGTVHVHYADNITDADKQLDQIIKLNCLRAKLEFLSNGIHNKSYYDYQTAVSLQAALETDCEADCNKAKEHLELMVKNATEERARIGRQFYMMSAGSVAAAGAFVLIGIGSLLSGGAEPTGRLLLSTGSGAIGALLSIFIALRDRTVAPDHDRKTNIIDGAARIGIGIISAFALHLLLTSGFLASVIAGAVTLQSIGTDPATATGTLGWKAALLIGFAGGFLERLVPDLLEKTKPPVTTSDKVKTTDPV